MINEQEFHAHWGVQLSAADDFWKFDEVRDLDPQHVWTIVESGSDDDGNWYAVPGCHFVNRLGYVFTARAWDEQTEDAIYFFDDIER